MVWTRPAATLDEDAHAAELRAATAAKLDTRRVVELLE
jgi:hypothetical protein